MFKKMKLLIGFACLPLFGFADNHASEGGNSFFNLQVQMCTLKDGVEMKDYDALINDFFKWSKKHDVEVTFVRQLPFLTHATATNPYPYDFIEFLGTNHANSGKGWDKWMSTKDGQKLNERWQSLAQCNVKMANVMRLYADANAMSTDNDRIAVWNWCTRKPGVTWDQLSAKHQSWLANSEDAPNIAWFNVFPHMGSASASGEFAHLVIYPNVEAMMKRTAGYVDGGWRVEDDYLTSYATCNGRSASIEQVLYRPTQ